MGKVEDEDVNHISSNSQKSEYRRWLTRLPFPAVLLNEDDRILYVNPAFVRSTGFLQKEVIGLNPPYPFWPANKRNRYQSGLSRKKWQSKINLLKKDGNTVQSEINLSRITGSEGHFYKLLVLSEITDRKSQSGKDPFSLPAAEKILDAIPIPVLINRIKDSRFTHINRAFEKTTGFPRDEMIGRKTDDLPWSRRQSGLKSPSNLVKLGQFADVEIKMLSQNGEPRTSILRSQKVKFGQTEYMVAANLDITDRKKAEESLLASEYRYSSTLDNIQEGCLIIDFNWRYLYVNDMVATRTGIPKQDLIGKTMMEVIPGVEKSEPFRIIKNCMQNRVLGRAETEFKQADGSHRWVDMSIHPVPEGLFILSIDIDSRKKAEEAAKRLSLQQQAIIDNIPDMAWLKDRQLRFVAVNKAFLKASRFPLEQILGKTDEELTGDKYTRKFRHDDEEVINRRIGITVEDQLSDWHGEKAWCETSKMPIFDEKGEVTGLVGIARDITARKKNQLELQRLNQILVTIRQIHQIITLEKDPQRLMETVCRNLTTVRGYNACWMVRLNKKRRLLNSADAKLGAVFDSIRESIEADRLPNCVREALNENKVIRLKNDSLMCQGCPTFRPISDNLEIIVVPVQYLNKTMGVITAFADSNLEVDSEEINLLRELAGDIGLAFNNIHQEEQRRKAEKDLKISEERYRLISETARDMIYRVNLTPKITLDYISPGFEKTLGYNQFSTEGILEQLLEILHPDDRPILQQMLAEPDTIDRAPVILRWQHQKGYYVIVEHSHSRICDEHDRTVAFIGIGRDITWRIQMEEDLKSSETFIKGLLEESPNPILVINLDGTIRQVNHALLNLTGFSEEEIIDREPGCPWWPPEKFNEYIQYKAFNYNQDRSRREWVFVNKQGEPFWVMITVATIYREGKLDCFLTTWVDITELHKIDEELKESERYSQGLLSNAPNPILVTEVNGAIKYVNRAFEEVSGYQLADLNGLILPYPWWPESLKNVYLQDDSTRQDQYTHKIERQYQKKNGDLFWIELSINKIKDDQGRVICHVANWVDITERKLAELAVQESQEKTRLIFTSIADGLLIADLRSKVIDCNNSAEALLRAPREDLIGRDLFDLVAPEARPSARAEVREAINKGFSEHIPNIMVRPDGTTFPADTVVTIAKNKSGQPLYLVISFQDITERKLLEDRILDLYEKEKKQREELQEEARTRGMFIDVLAHELRTPLTPILASTGMLQDLLGVSEEPIFQKLCENISNGAEILAHRLEELLDIARYSRGVFHLNRLPTNLGIFIKDTLFRFKPTLDQRKQKLITDINPDLPMVEVDPSRLEQVIVNLLSNASKFSLEDGQIFVRADYINGNIEIDVRDEGIGITPEEQSRLFQPYHRVEQDRQKFPGIGLGLAVSRQIVEAHGGTIQVESQPGRGSTFSVRIPARQYTL